MGAHRNREQRRTRWKCWTTRIGKYVLIVNTGSRTITRALGTGTNIFINTAVAASIATGGAPTDADAENG